MPQSHPDRVVIIGGASAAAAAGVEGVGVGEGVADVEITIIIGAVANRNLVVCGIGASVADLVAATTVITMILRRRMMTLMPKLQPI